MEGCTPTPYPSLDKLEFTGVKISLVIFWTKNFAQQELFCPNVNKIKEQESWDN